MANFLDMNASPHDSVVDHFNSTSITFELFRVYFASAYDFHREQVVLGDKHAIQLVIRTAEDLQRMHTNMVAELLLGRRLERKELEAVVEEPELLEKHFHTWASWMPWWCLLLLACFIPMEWTEHTVVTKIVKHDHHFWNIDPFIAEKIPPNHGRPSWVRVVVDGRNYEDRDAVREAHERSRQG